MKRNFLVVAANGQQREALAGDLRARGFTVTRAENGNEAERAVTSVNFDAVLVESHLPDMSTAELSTRLEKIRPECRVVSVTNFDQVRNSLEQLQFGTGDYLMKSEQILDLLSAPFEVGKESGTSYGHRGNEALIEVLDVLVGLLELDDQSFDCSSHKAMQLARGVAEELSADHETVEEIVIATLVRDVGKASAYPEIATEGGKYTDSERGLANAHVQASLRLFEHIDFPWKILPIVRHHHERYDGSGVPDGLKGRAIPMGARVVSVVEAYLSLAADRGSANPQDVLAQLVQKAGSYFDPEVIEALQRVLTTRIAEKQSRETPVVLVVDPQEDFRQLLKLRLVNEGLEVREVSHVGMALDSMLTDPPDLVLVDVDDNASEALQLLDLMREVENLCRVPYACLSRRSDRLLKIRALRHGVDDFLQKNDNLAELVARVENILTREAFRRGGVARSVPKGISGDLESLALPDLVQTLTMGMKTARLTLHSDGNKGQIWFESGTATHAKLQKTTGEDAFLEMVRWTEGEFVLEHGVQCKQHTIQRDAMFLLMEGMRLLDESQRETAPAAS